MSETCPDCKGTGVYRGLNSEEPCLTCSTAVQSVLRAADAQNAFGRANRGFSAQQIEGVADRAINRAFQRAGKSIERTADGEFRWNPDKNLAQLALDRGKEPSRSIRFVGRLEPDGSVTVEQILTDHHEVIDWNRPIGGGCSFAISSILPPLTGDIATIEPD